MSGRKLVKEVFRNIIELIIGYPFLFLSFLIPRSRRVWVFGSHIGFNGNSKELLLYARENNLDIIPVWISPTMSEAREIRRLGFAAYFRWSIKGIYYCLRAKFYFYNFRLSDINYWTSGRAVVINLWHGFIIKEIEFLQKKGFMKIVFNNWNIIFRFFAPYIYRKPDYAISTTPDISRFFEKAFRIEENQCLPFGTSRTDNLFKDKGELIKIAQKYAPDTASLIEETRHYKSTYIYMPTWRDNSCDFVSDANFDFRKLDREMSKRDCLFIFKPHPFTTLKKEIFSELKNIKMINGNIDMYYFLPFTDILITDYSSVYNEYLLINNKKLLLFPFDLEEYTKTCRNFIFPYDTFMPGKRVYTFGDLLSAIENEDFSSSEDLAETRKYFWGNYSGDASRKICDFVCGL